MKKRVIDESAKYVNAVNNVVKKTGILMMANFVFLALVKSYQKIMIRLMVRLGGLRVRSYQKEKMVVERDFRIK